MKRTATDVLRDHARERWLRRAIRSVNLDGDRGATRRMGETAWVASCGLVVGVPGVILDVLGVRECLGARVWDTIEGIDLPERTIEVMVEQLSGPPTLVQAARYLGLAHSRAQLAKARLEAIQRVTENMLRRAGQGESLDRAQGGTSS
jgi:hypothetical protein